MKKLVVLWFGLSLSMSILESFAQDVTEISLLSGWVFQKGDNPEWKNPDFDDSGWIKIRPTGYWDYLPGMGDYDGKPGEFLKLDRIWKGGERINIIMEFPLVVLNGGKSYPDHYALKYGNQVLAVNANVNRLENLDTVVFNRSVKPKIKKSKD